MTNIVPQPFAPLVTTEQEDSCRIDLWGRSYVYDHALMPTQLITQGQDLLYAPARLTGIANGTPIVWEDEHCYVMSASERKTVINTYAQSDCLIANTTFACEYDGGVRWDVTIMPRGKTVAQVFGVEAFKQPGYDLTQLHLEIPLKKQLCPLYICYRTALPTDGEGNALPLNGSIPASGLHLPFSPLLWLGNEDVGLQIAPESDEMWQPGKDAIEVIDAGDHYVLSLHLLDSRPRKWVHPDDNSCPISFSLGLIATPVKPFDKSVARLRSVHIDCFTKVPNDYWDFLSGPITENATESVLDRLQRAGVELLVLHEKWNKLQNDWRVPPMRAAEIHRIVEACHARGIKVIPYFGYEISTAMPDYAQTHLDIIVNNERVDESDWMWHRTPWQRPQRVCYASYWAERYAKGVLSCIEQFDFDGVYFDTLTDPSGCNNLRHGCGYLDEQGNRHLTYPIFAVREMFKTICDGVHARGGIVNPHLSGAFSPIIFGLADMVWDGEHIQTAIRDQGAASFSLEYFRAEYMGRNTGVPVQFIVYEFPPVWTFDKSLSLALPHGIYPRPNSVWHPLDVMERIWNILDDYGIADADFRGYWEQEDITTSAPAAKVSFYEKNRQKLIYLSNPTDENLSDVELILPENTVLRDAETKELVQARAFDLGAYDLRIFLAETK